MKKVLSIYVWCVVALVAATCVACINEDTSGQPSDNDILLPVVLRIPADDVSTRVLPGDPPPGSEEVQKPRYAYIYMAVENGVSTRILYDGPQSLDSDKWVLETWSGDEPQSSGDLVYRYDDLFYLTMPATRTAARVYAAVSYDAITMPSTPTSEDDLRNMAVSFSGFADYSHIRHVYATPADYAYDLDGDQEAEYFGTVQHIGESALSVSLMLYHVASRVDLIWNVSPEARSSVQISDMQLTGLKVQGCKIFRPTQNVGVGSTPATLSGPTFDPGNQWNGRHYFYAIPFQESESENYFPFTIEIKKNGEGSASYTQEIHINASPSDAQGDLIGNKLLGTGTVFVPWLRGELVIEN